MQGRHQSITRTLPRSIPFLGLSRGAYCIAVRIVKPNRVYNQVSLKICKTVRTKEREKNPIANEPIYTEAPKTPPLNWTGYLYFIWLWGDSRSRRRVGERKERSFFFLLKESRRSIRGLLVKRGNTIKKKGGQTVEKEGRSGKARRGIYIERGLEERLLLWDRRRR